VVRKDKEEVKNSSFVAFRAYEEAKKTTDSALDRRISNLSRFPVGVFVALDTVTRPSLSR
jgi:hypothetical protein